MPWHWPSSPSIINTGAWDAPQRAGKADYFAGTADRNPAWGIGAADDIAYGALSAMTITFVTGQTLQQFRDLLQTAGPAGAAAGPLELAEPAWTGFRALKVTKVVPESTTVSSIYLAAADETRLPAAQAGQYLTLRIPGVGTPASVRSYSLSSAPDASSYRISVKREPRGIASTYRDLR